jgi:hypothetical protein
MLYYFLDIDGLVWAGAYAVGAVFVFCAKVAFYYVGFSWVVGFYDAKGAVHYAHKAGGALFAVILDQFVLWVFCHGSAHAG